MLMPIFSPPVYNANAVTFDGTNDYLTLASGLTGITSVKTFTISFWVRSSYTGGNQYIITQRVSGVYRLRLFLDSGTGVLQLAAQSSTPTGILSANGTTNLCDGAWHHVLISIDLQSSSNRYVYIDDVAESMTWVTYSNTNIDFAGVNEVGLFSNYSTTSKLNGDVAEFYFDNSYLNMSTTSNRRLFITSDLKPAKRANSGLIWLTGDTSAWETNKGTGGGFTENGALTTSSNLPVQV